MSPKLYCHKNSIVTKTEMSSKLWKQLIGVAMGIHPAPPFANIYLAKRIDKQIEKFAFKYGKDGKSSILMMKRFLDDILKVFQGSTKQLHSLL